MRTWTQVWRSVRRGSGGIELNRDHELHQGSNRLVRTVDRLEMAELAAAMAADEKLTPLVSGELPLQKADGTWTIRDVKSPTVAVFCPELSST